MREGMRARTHNTHKQKHTHTHPTRARVLVNVNFAAGSLAYFIPSVHTHTHTHTCCNRLTPPYANTHIPCFFDRHVCICSRTPKECTMDYECPAAEHLLLISLDKQVLFYSLAPRCP